MSKRFQFSIRALLLLAVAVAIPVSVLSGDITQSSAVAIVVVAMIMPAMTCSAIFATAGYQKAFFIGASVPALAGAAFVTLSLLYLQDNDIAGIENIAEENGYKVAFTLLWGCVPVAGIAGVAAMWLASRSEPDTKNQAA